MEARVDCTGGVKVAISGAKVASKSVIVSK